MKRFESWMGMLVVGVAVLMAGCDEPLAPDANVPLLDVPRQQVEGTRFKVERQGYFNAGYQNNGREILIITDQRTGAKYLGITGVGVTEFHQENEGKTTVTREE